MVRDILYPGLGQAPVGSAVGHLVNREGLLIGRGLLVVFLQNPKAPTTFVDPGNLKRVCEKNFWDPGKGPDLDELDSLADAEVGDPSLPGHAPNGVDRVAGDLAPYNAQQVVGHNCRLLNRTW